MELNLREYQFNVLKKIAEPLKDNKNVLAQLPTGAGKTIIALGLMKALIKKGIKVFFVVHRGELIDQTSKSCNKYGIEHGFITSKEPPKYHRSVQLCSVQTLANRLMNVGKIEKTKEGKFNHIIIWDEAHHIAAKTYRKIFNYFSDAVHVGLTATPKRRDNTSLGLFFDTMVSLDDVIYSKDESSVRWLINNKYLSDYKIFALPTINRDSLKIVRGEFETKSTVAQISDKFIVGEIVNNWKKQAAGLKTIAFAINIEHAKKISETFNNNHVPATYITGQEDKATRNIKLKDFAVGRYDVVVNVALFDEGFDISAASGMDVCIKCVILASPTTSLCKYLQMVGRGLRKSSCGKPAIILDHAQNSFKSGDEVHGMPCKKRNWSLDGNNFFMDGVKLYQCKSCHVIFDAKLKNCPECGEKKKTRKRKKRKILETENHELKEITAAQVKAREEEKQERIFNCKTVKEIIKNSIMSEKQAKALLERNAIKKKQILEIKNIAGAAKAYGINTQLPNKMFLKTTQELTALKQNILNQIGG